MSYPVPNYETATLPVTVDVANEMLGVLTGMAKGAGINNVGLFDPPKLNVQEWMLGLAIRQGLPHLSPGSVGAQFVDRFDARVSAVTPTGSLLFAADVALATAIAAASGRTLAQVYRTAAHIYLSLLHNDAHRFLVPNF